MIKTIFLLLVTIFSTNTYSQNLSFSQKRIWRNELRKMEKTDQFYRVKMAEHPELENDSIWRLQTMLDSTNKSRFVELTTQYGYPSKKNIGKEASIALILHFTNESDFSDLKDLFKNELTKGNMLPKYYAWWYDRCQRNMNKPIYFGQYTNDTFCGELLALFNERRKEIGLEELVASTNCE